MEKEEIKPEFLGNLQCMDIDKQCYLGEGTLKTLMADENKQSFFENECTNRKGRQIRCCHPDLINVPYLPGPLEVPHMIQGSTHNQYKACPAKIKADCFRETKRNQPLCIQNVCLDNGYRVASNYYEICKALKLRQREFQIEIPDCSTAGCWGNRFRINEEEAEIEKETVASEQSKIVKLEDERTQANQDIKNIEAQIAEIKKINKTKIKKHEETFQIGGAENTADQLANLERQLAQRKRELKTVEVNLEESGVYCKQKPNQLCFDIKFFKDSLKESNWFYNIGIVALAIIAIFILILNFAVFKA
jgi:hypothetical protein